MSVTAVVSEGLDFSTSLEFSIKADEFQAFRELIYAESGISLNSTKKDLVSSRLAKRLRHFGFGSFAEYYQYLIEDDTTGAERQIMINCLTTNKTDFFRESHHFDFLRNSVLPTFCARAKQGERRKIRIWSAGCSTGEEPYTIAITLKENLDRAFGWDVRILASDIDTECLNKATAGIYPSERLELVPTNLRNKYFTPTTDDPTGLLSASNELRQLITFRRVNLIEETWPIRAQFDVIFCRNVIIYFDRETQKRLMERFASMLSPNGFLFLGHSESMQGLTDCFEPIGGSIYRLKKGAKSEVASLPVESSPIVIDGMVRRDENNQRPIAGSSFGIPSLEPDLRFTLAEENLTVGDVRASREPAVLKTVLGSCVSACLYDPEAKVGGMNHFALPTGAGSEGFSTRFGIHAMELLINEIMRLGGDRRRIRAKVFGGSNIQNLPFSIGHMNAQFILNFLSTENIPLVAYHLGGATGWSVHFYTHTGRALVKPLDSCPLIDGNETSKRQLFEKLARAEPENIVLF